MAKFSRYDSRNKKSGRNKLRSLTKDHRIKEEVSKNKLKFKDFVMEKKDDDT